MPQKNKKEKEKFEDFIFGKTNDDDDDDDCIIESKNNHIYFYSDVNNKSAFEFKKILQKIKLELQGLNAKFDMKPPIHLHINSNGGCLFSGFCIIDAIRKAQNEGFEIYTYCEGKVASAGTLISVHGDKRFIDKNAVMLIHQLSSVFWGKFHEIEDDYENCKMLMKKLKDVYRENCNFKKRDLDKLLKRDLWLESQDCKKYGLIDEIL